MASARVLTTSMMDSRTTTTLSKATRHSRPGGKLFSSLAISAMTPLKTSMALAEGRRVMPMPWASRPMKRRLEA